MFDTVIVPLDGTPHAEYAIPFALDEAQRHGAAILLLHVVPRPEPCTSTVRRSGPVPWQGEWPAPGYERAVRAAHEYLHDVSARFALGPEPLLRVAVGHPGRRIVAEAKDHARPLVVMTTGDPVGSPHQQRSHVADYLLATGCVPLLCVRQPSPADSSHVSVPPEALRVMRRAPNAAAVYQATI